MKILRSILNNNNSSICVIWCLIVLVFYCQLKIDNLFGQQLEQQPVKPYQLPLDQKLPKSLFDSDNGKKWIEYINEELKGYSNNIVESTENLIMLRYPCNWHKIIRLTPAVVKASDDGHKITLADKSIVYFDLVINNNTDESLRNVVLYAARYFLASSRISSWSKKQIKLKPEGPNFERINFASYYYPLNYKNIYFINAQNIFITIEGTDPLQKNIDKQIPHV
jgi:hypothetical protein